MRLSSLKSVKQQLLMKPSVLRTNLVARGSLWECGDEPEELAMLMFKQ